MKHKHHDIIVAWAADTSKVVQCKGKYLGDWEDLTCVPAWSPTLEYRIKPESKPDYTVLVEVSHDSFHGPQLSLFTTDLNLSLTFDGETGQLKAAAVLK